MKCNVKLLIKKKRVQKEGILISTLTTYLETEEGLFLVLNFLFNVQETNVGFSETILACSVKYVYELMCHFINSN